MKITTENTFETAIVQSLIEHFRQIVAAKIGARAKARFVKIKPQI